MRLIGFDFTKISGEKKKEFEQDYQIITNLDIADITEENPGLLKNMNIIKIFFKYGIAYAKKQKEDKKQGELLLEGNLIFSGEKKEIDEVLDIWKKKEISQNFKLSLLNIIMKKCLSKAFELEDSLNLPFHIPLPQLRPEQGKPKEKSEKDNKKEQEETDKEEEDEEKDEKDIDEKELEELSEDEEEENEESDEE